MTIKTSFAFIVALVLAGCGGSTPPKSETPPPEGTGAAAESEKPAADMPEEKSSDADKGGGDAKAESKAPEMAPKLDKPASESMLSGKSVSSIEGTDLQGALKKLGWAKDDSSVTGGKAGSYENLHIDIAKGKEKGYVEITRPASEPGEASSSGTSPSDQKEAKEKDGAAVYYDDSADVLVAVNVEGKSADAKKLLGQLVKVAKKKPAPKPAGKAPPKAPAPKKK
jgi:hypothetical protein